MIGQTLREVRIKHGYTQTYVAKRIGIAVSNYCDIEHDKYPIKVIHLEWFSEFYGLPKVELSIKRHFEQKLKELYQKQFASLK
jgi:transcriptional regulator with XRE-family HTH domain